MGLETKSRLRAVDCYQIGIYAFKATVFTRSIEWLERAFNIIKLENDTSISLDMVENALRQAIQMHNHVLQNEPKNMYVYQQPFEIISPTNNGNGNGSESNQKKNIKLKRKLEEMGHELYRKTDVRNVYITFKAYKHIIMGLLTNIHMYVNFYISSH